MTGDGWTWCAQGHQHWGRYGAAGLLLRARGHVLLQLRAGWSHEGGTWGVPGGARHPDENAEAAALRETGEEVAVDLGSVRVLGVSVEDHGGWSYTTVVARAPSLLAAAVGNGETVEVRWVPDEAVTDLPLHPGFAAAWPRFLAGFRAQA